MKSVLLKFAILFFLAVSTSLSANEIPATNIEGDHFVLHLNKSFFVTGETIWYTLYTPNALKGVTFTMEAQLVDNGGNIKDSYFLKAEGEPQLEGYYKIPFDWTSGYYTLVFSGIDEASKSRVELAKVSLPVYNDLEKLPAGLEVEVIENTPGNKVVGSAGSLDINLDKASYNKGDQVNANIIVKDANGKPVKATVSVSVIDHKLGGDQLLYNSSVHTFYDNKVPTTKLSSDLYAFGKITKKDNSPLKASIIGAYSALENKVHYMKSDAEGKYAIKLPDFHGQKPLQVLLYKSLENFNVLDERKVEMKQGLKPAKMVYTDAIIEYLKQSQSRKKVYQFYGGVENDLTTASVSVERSSIKPGLVYKMAEYESFDNIGEFFIEVTTPLKFKLNEKKNKFSASIVNPRQYTSSTKTLSGDPLYIIDGKVTKDADFVGKLRLNEVDQVKLYYNPNKLNDHYRAIAVGGIAEISTTKEDFHIPLEDEEDIFVVKGIQLKGTFGEALQEDQNIPNFKPQVYWNPMIKTNNKGQAKLSFQQSDDISTFVVKVVAQTISGDVIYGEKIYEVKRASK